MQEIAQQLADRFAVLIAAAAKRIAEQPHPAHADDIPAMELVRGTEYLESETQALAWLQSGWRAEVELVIRGYQKLLAATAAGDPEALDIAQAAVARPLHGGLKLLARYAASTDRRPRDLPPA